MKKWYKSRTIWLNIIAVVAFATQQFTGYIVDPTAQGLAIAVLNGVLRFDTESTIG